MTKQEKRLNEVIEALNQCNKNIETSLNNLDSKIDIVIKGLVETNESINNLRKEIEQLKSVEVM